MSAGRAARAVLVDTPLRCCERLHDGDDGVCLEPATVAADVSLPCGCHQRSFLCDVHAPRHHPIWWRSRCEHGDSRGVVTYRMPNEHDLPENGRWIIGWPPGSTEPWPVMESG